MGPRLRTGCLTSEINPFQQAFQQLRDSLKVQRKQLLRVIVSFERPNKLYRAYVSWMDIRYIIYCKSCFLNASAVSGHGCASTK